MFMLKWRINYTLSVLLSFYADSFAICIFFAHHFIIFFCASLYHFFCTSLYHLLQYTSMSLLSSPMYWTGHLKDINDSIWNNINTKWVIQALTCVAYSMNYAYVTIHLQWSAYTPSL
jgi:hypothetical protein